MELLILAVTALAALAALMMVHRRRQVVAWDHELEQAFGTSAGRDIAGHRRL